MGLKFHQNYAEIGGSIYINEGVQNTRFDGCSFMKNYARMHGGVFAVMA